MARRSTNFDHIRTCLVRGKRFKVKWRMPPSGGKNCKGKVSLGQCDSPNDRGKTLYLSPQDWDPQLLLGTVIHEVLHGACFDLDESAVSEYEHSLMRLLRRMGMEVRFSAPPKRRSCAKAEA